MLTDVWCAWPDGGYHWQEIQADKKRLDEIGLELAVAQTEREMQESSEARSDSKAAAETHKTRFRSWMPASITRPRRRADLVYV